MIKEKLHENAPEGQYIKLGKEYDLTIGETRIDPLIDALIEAREDINKPGTSATIALLESTLQNAIDERLKVLKTIKEYENKGYVHRFSTNMLVMPNELMSTVSKINKVLKNEDEPGENTEVLSDEGKPVEENHIPVVEENAEIDTETSVNEVDEETVVNKPSVNESEKEYKTGLLYKSIRNDINKYSKKLDSEVQQIEKEEIQLFINSNINIILELLDKPEYKKLDEGDILIKSLNADLKRLNNLNLKLNPSEETEEEPAEKIVPTEIKTIEEKEEKVETEKTETSLNENPEKTIHRLIDLKNKKDNLYISDEYEDMMRSSSNNLLTRVAEAVGEYNKAFNLGSSVQILDEKMSKIADLQEEFKKFKSKFIKKGNKENAKERKSINNFKEIHLAEELSMDDISIILTTPELKRRIEDSINEYNEQVRTNISNEVVSRFRKTVDKLMSEFKLYKKTYKENILKPKDKNPENNNQADKHTEVAEETETEKEAKETETKIYKLKEGEDYSEIYDDAGFDTWLTNMDKMLREHGADISSEVKDVKDWYKEYQDVLPYVEKLNIIFEDIKKGTTEDVELLGSKNYIDLLIYEIHTKKGTDKMKIDRVFDSYTKQKESEKTLEAWKKREELKVTIEKSKNKGGATSRKITEKQIQEVLESRGEENTAENVNELKNFLEDLNLNYDYYCSGTKEGELGNSRVVYEKYRTVGAKNTEPEKIPNWSFRKLWSRVSASFSTIGEVDDQDKYNQFIDMLKDVREFDLVDRKNGNTQKTEENKSKMTRLLSYLTNNSETFDKYLTNENSIDISGITQTEEDKELFERAISLYKTFTRGKYRTSEAKAKAESILSQNERPETTDTETTIEMLYTVPLERELFEREAKLSINRDIISSVAEEIESLKKSKSKTLPELVKLQEKFEKAQKVLEEIGNEEDIEEIKNTALKLSVLRLKNINTENLKELSESFPTYEYILSSKDIKKEEKTEYIKILIYNLTKLKRNKDKKPHTIFNAQLDAIIEKYQKVLKSI